MAREKLPRWLGAETARIQRKGALCCKILGFEVAAAPPVAQVARDMSLEPQNLTTQSMYLGAKIVMIENSPSSNFSIGIERIP